MFSRREKKKEMKRGERKRRERWRSCLSQPIVRFIFIHSFIQQAAESRVMEAAEKKGMEGGEEEDEEGGG